MSDEKDCRRTEDGAWGRWKGGKRGEGEEERIEKRGRVGVGGERKEGKRIEL